MPVVDPGENLVVYVYVIVTMAERERERERFGHSEK